MSGPLVSILDVQIHQAIEAPANAPARKHRYLTLKVCVRNKKEPHPVKPPSDHEITVSNHLQSFSFGHPGKAMVRTVLESFEVPGPDGHHKCLLYQPLGMSYTEFLKLHPKCMFAKELVQRSAQLLLLTLDYLHQCHVVHTGRCVSSLGENVISANNS